MDMETQAIICIVMAFVGGYLIGQLVTYKPKDEYK